MMRKLLAATVAALAVLAMTSAAHAQQYPPSASEVLASSTTPGPGEEVTVTASCFLGEVTFTLIDPDDNTTELGTATADDEGVATFSFNAPTEPGTYTVEAAGTGCDEEALVLGLTIEVAADDTSMATTGANTFPMVRTAAVLITLGGLLVAGAVGYRRRAVA